MYKNKKIQSRRNKHLIPALRTKSYGMILCLSILFFYLIRPALPYIEYSVDKEYISKNLCIKKDIPGNCCQGKCYLLEQIKLNSDPVTSTTGNNKKNVPDQKVEDHLPSEGISYNPFEKVSTLITNYSFRIIGSFYTTFFVPPKF